MAVARRGASRQEAETRATSLLLATPTRTEAATCHNTTTATTTRTPVEVVAAGITTNSRLSSNNSSIIHHKTAAVAEVVVHHISHHNTHHHRIKEDMVDTTRTTSKDIHLNSTRVGATPSSNKVTATISRTGVQGIPTITDRDKLIPLLYIPKHVK